MDARLIALKLLLEELDVPSDLTTLQDRKLLQKAVYLGQQTGVDLGYRFGWYIRGPYGTALTRDCYSLREALAAGEQDYESKTFSLENKSRLARAKELLRVPKDVALGQPDWAELVASLHFLLEVGKYSKEEAFRIIREEKPGLAEYLDQAYSQILEHPLK